jgi:hypothetical protein
MGYWGIDKLIALIAIIPLFQVGKQNGCPKIPYYQQFVEFPTHIIYRFSFIILKKNRVPGLPKDRTPD